MDHQIIIKQLFLRRALNLLHYQNTRRIHGFSVHFLVDVVLHVVFCKPCHAWRSFATYTRVVGGPLLSLRIDMCRSGFPTSNTRKLQHLRVTVSLLTPITSLRMKVQELTSYRAGTVVRDCVGGGIRSTCQRSVTMAGLVCRCSTSTKLLDALYSPCMDLCRSTVEQKI